MLFFYLRMKVSNTCELVAASKKQRDKRRRMEQAGKGLGRQPKVIESSTWPAGGAMSAAGLPFSPLQVKKS